MLKDFFVYPGSKYGSRIFAVVNVTALWVIIVTETFLFNFSFKSNHVLPDDLLRISVPALVILLILNSTAKVIFMSLQKFNAMPVECKRRKTIKIPVKTLYRSTSKNFFLYKSCSGT